jgi:hypothetical protein
MDDQADEQTLATTAQFQEVRMRSLTRVVRLLTLTAALFILAGGQSPAASEPPAIPAAAQQTRLVVLEAFMRDG